MNEVEKNVINSFKEKNKGIDEYAYLSDEEILKINPVTPYDYIEYYHNLILELTKQLQSCQECINKLESEMPKDYMSQKETLEYIKEEVSEINRIQIKINEYTAKKNEYLKQTMDTHIK